MAGEFSLWPYDLFVSYARKDNQPGGPGQPGWIDAFLAELVREHRSFTTVDLAVFLDREAIRAMDDWRCRIRVALRQSKMLLAFISPNYFASPHCRWEWQEYIEHEVDRALGDEGIAPIYFVEVSGFESGQVQEQLAAWVSDLNRRNHVDLRPWYPEGVTALQRDTVRQRLAALNQDIAERLDRMGRALAAPGTVDRHNPNFVGRTTELAALRRMLAERTVGVITTVHGLGGVGKSALATEYAHAFAAEYPGGRWLVNCEGQEDLAVALLALATPLGIEFTEAERTGNTKVKLDRILAELRTRALAADKPACLLVLDNVDRPALLAVGQVGGLPKVPWLHVLATTRLEPGLLLDGSPDRAFLPLDELQERDAVNLIRKHQRGGEFASEAEEEAAWRIVARLGYFTLAVEAVAVYLGLYDDVTCAAFLRRIEEEGPLAPGGPVTDETVRHSIRHREKDLALALGPTLGRLSPEERLVLEYATVFPPNHVPLPWLRELAAERFPALGEEPSPGYPDPWRQIERRLLGLRLLIPTAEPKVVRMHRLLQDLIAGRTEFPSRERRSRGVEHAIRRAAYLFREGWAEQNRWENEPLRQYALMLMSGGDAGGAEIANDVQEPLRQMGRIEEAGDLLNRAIKLNESKTDADQLTLAKSYSNLGVIEWERRNPANAASLYRRAIAIEQELLGPDDHRLSVRYCNLAVAERLLGHLGEAKELVLRALRIQRNAPGVDPRELAASFNNLATIEQELGNLRDARHALGEAIAVARGYLGPTHPTLAVYYGNLASLEHLLDDFDKAHELQEEAITILRAKLGPDHPTLAHHYGNMAAIEAESGNPAQARLLLEQAMTIVRSKISPDHPELAGHYASLARIEHAAGNPAKARELILAAIGIQEKAFGPQNPELLQMRSQLAVIEQAMGAPTTARDRLRRTIDAQRNTLPPNHPNLLNNCVILVMMERKLGNFLEAQRILLGLLNSQEATLAQDDPVLATTYGLMALVEEDLGHSAEAVALTRRAYAIFLAKLGHEHANTRRVREWLAEHDHDFVDGRPNPIEEERDWASGPITAEEQAARRAGDQKRLGAILRMKSKMLMGRAQALYTADRLDAALLLYREQEHVARELGDAQDLSSSLGNQGLILQTQGHLEEAMPLHKEEERLCRELGDAQGLQACLGNQALILRARGDLVGALSLHDEEEEICRRIGDRAALDQCLANRALVLEEMKRRGHGSPGA